MKYSPVWTMAALVAVGVTLGACHVLKPKPVAKNAVVTERVVPRPAPTLESLDVRVQDLENSRARARAAAKARVRVAVPVVR